MFKTRTLAALLLAGCAVQVSAATDVSKVIASPKYKAAVSVLDKQHDQIVGDIIKLTEIPSPPFKEKARGEAYLDSDGYLVCDDAPPCRESTDLTSATRRVFASTPLL